MKVKQVLGGDRDSSAGKTAVHPTARNCQLIWHGLNLNPGCVNKGQGCVFLSVGKMQGKNLLGCPIAIMGLWKSKAFMTADTGFLSFCTLDPGLFVSD